MFEGDPKFSELGINIGVMQPGQPACMYHGENAQEDFLILSGEAVLVIEGEERRLKQWDFVHCPPWAEHVIVATGSEPCVVLSVGARPEGFGREAEIVYPGERSGRRTRRERRHGDEGAARGLRWLRASVVRALPRRRPAGLSVATRGAAPTAPLSLFLRDDPDGVAPEEQVRVASAVEPCAANACLRHADHEP